MFRTLMRHPQNSSSWPLHKAPAFYDLSQLNQSCVFLAMGSLLLRICTIPYSKTGLRHCRRRPPYQCVRQKNVLRGVSLQKSHWQVRSCDQKKKSSILPHCQACLQSQQIYFRHPYQRHRRLRCRRLRHYSLRHSSLARAIRCRDCAGISGSATARPQRPRICHQLYQSCYHIGNLAQTPAPTIGQLQNVQHALMPAMGRLRNSVRRSARGRNVEKGGRGVRMSACGLRPRQAANLRSHSPRFREARPVQLSVAWQLVARCQSRHRARCLVTYIVKEAPSEGLVGSVV